VGRWHLLPIVVVVVFVAYLTRTSWLGCIGAPFTIDVWLHQTKVLACQDVTLFFERPDKVVGTCGNRRDATTVRTGEPFSVCGRRFRADIERSYPEERYRLTVTVPRR
jgi:hypothetical protein